MLRAALLSSHPFDFRWLISSIEKNEMGRTCSANGGRGVYRVLVGKPERRRPIERPRRRWEDNIKMYLQEVGCGDMDWLELAQDRDNWRAVVNVVMKPSGSIKCGEFLDYLKTC
jgi:hypothetical protein